MLGKLALISGIACASTAVAGGTEFRCVSDVTHDEIRISQPEEGADAQIFFHDIEGAATVAHGLDGVTFIHIKESEVWTFVLHFPTMKYELSTHGSENLEDHGQCVRGNE